LTGNFPVKDRNVTIKHYAQSMQKALFQELLNYDQGILILDLLGLWIQGTEG
jgi:hypothetical protein